MDHAIDGCFGGGVGRKGLVSGLHLFPIPAATHGAAWQGSKQVV